MLENTTDSSNNRSNDSTGNLDFRSLWAETLVQTLYDAIENNWSGNSVTVILKQLQKKGYDRKLILELVNQKFGKSGCDKLIKHTINQKNGLLRH